MQYLINVKELIELYEEMGYSTEEAVKLTKEELAERRVQGRKSDVQFAKQPKGGGKYVK